MDKLKNMLGISSTSNGSNNANKRGGGWVSPNIGVEKPYANGQRRPPIQVSQEQFEELKSAVVELQMHENITDEIIYKTCQICPNDNNTAID